jgi:DNA polymerase-3 subunit beta
LLIIFKERQLIMECKILKNDLFDLVQKSYPFIPLKSSLQILSNFKLSFYNGKIEISATDLDHSILISSQINCSGEKEMTLNAKKLFEIVRELPEGEILIKDDENVLIIESKNGFSCKIAAMTANDFPQFPSVEERGSFLINIKELKDLIIKSSFAVSKDESRKSLCGILWNVEKNKMGMVATDGHRLGSSFIYNDFNIVDKQAMIVSPKTLLHLIRILDSNDTNKSISITCDDKYVVFNDGSMKICSKLIEGPYPDFEKVIPKNNPKIAIIEKYKLLDAFKRVSVLSNQKTHLVKCTFNSDMLEVSVINRDIGGEAHENVSVSFSGEPHVIGFNALYLMEILNIINQPKIRVEMNTQISACLLFPQFEKIEDKKTDDTFLIMPLRIMEEN